MNYWKLIYWKELRDFLKDKRSRNSALVMPMFIIVFMLILLGYLQDTLSQAKNQTIHIISSTTNSPTSDAIRKLLVTSKFTVKDVASEDLAKKGINDGSIKVALEFEKPIQGKPNQIKEFYDPNNESASIPKGILDSVFSEFNKKMVGAILTTAGLPESMAEPNHLVEVKVTHGKASASEELIGLLPYLIVLWAFYGGMGAVGDLVAGEKEKNTLETLLVTPASRTNIALGKLLALATLCFGSSMSSLIGVMLVGLFKLPMTASFFKAGLGISLGSFGVTLLVIIPTVMMFASLLLAISAIAKNIRECYSHLAIVNIVVLTPAILSQFIGYTDFARSHLVALVPVLNAANAMRQALSGTYDWVSILGTVAVNGTIATCLLVWTISLFNRENVLLKN